MQLDKKEEKRLYDVEYNKRNKEKKKKQAKEWYDKIKVTKEYKDHRRRYRKTIRKEHTEYCRRPDQIEKTKLRDFKRQHGEYGECFELIEEIIKLVKEYYSENNCGVAPKYLRLKSRGYIFNKHKK